MANMRTIGGAVFLAALIRIMLVEPFEIQGPSMEPTLLNGDKVVVIKCLYGIFLPFTDVAVVNWGSPDPGDVVIVDSPYDSEDIVKRVIGVAGDTVEVRDDVVYRNGEALEIRIAGPCATDEGTEDPTDCEWVEEHIGERHWHTSRSQLSVPESMAPREVPAGHIFVMGDHRDRSNDSRNPMLGMIPASRVRGRALGIYWSSEERVRWSRVFEGVH